LKNIDGIIEENGNIYYKYNGEKINLTAIGDECGTLHMRKAMKILIDKTGIDAKMANNIMYQVYNETPPNREKLKKQQEDNEIRSKELNEYKEFAKKLDAEKANEPIKCPKCGSTSLSANKKGFGIGKAIVGGAVAGPLGLMAGNIGSKKVRVTCLKCGHQFWAGKG